MLEASFDIFSGTPDKDPLWIETVYGLSNARQRMGEIAERKPGRYFVFSLGSHSVLAQIETFVPPAVVPKAESNRLRVVKLAAEDNQMTDSVYPSWQVPYEQALIECNPDALQQKIEAAENAIFHRFQELAGQSNHGGERVALNDALRALRSLQIQLLNYPKLPSE